MCVWGGGGGNTHSVQLGINLDRQAMGFYVKKAVV